MKSFCRGAVLLACLVGCSAQPAPEIPPLAPSAGGGAVHFSLVTLEGKIVSRATWGRAPLAILFVTTFDLPSQLAARRLADVAVKMGCGALGIVLEPPENRVLVEAFGKALRLPYPLAMAGADVRRGEGPFGRISGVPTLLVLDRRGRIAYRSEGVPSSQQIADAFGIAARR